MKPLARKTVIAGFGLIGASLAAAGKRAGVLGRVVGVGRSAANLDVARSAGLADETTHDLAAALADADLLVLAAPADACVRLLEQAVPSAPEACILTDVASVKAPLCAAAERLGVDARFVGGHPIAGGTATGASAADPNLFRGRTVVLTPSAQALPNARALVAGMWRAVGAEIVELDASVHDRVLATTSHLPQMVASALCAVAAAHGDRELVERFAGPGFRDTTRIAASDAAMWSAIARLNRDRLLEAMDAFGEVWANLRDGVAAGDEASIRATIERGAELRRRIDKP
jgi:prephenate dehydrogenase